MKKIGILFAAIIITVLFAVSASALEPTGRIGDNVYWTFNETTGELIISGEGEMYDYDTYNSPLTGNIISIIVENGVRSIGDFAFASCPFLETIAISDSVTSIGENAFRGCSELKSISIPDSVTSIENDAFMYSGLADITMGNGVTSIGACAFYGTSYYNDESNWENGILYIDEYLVATIDSVAGECIIKDGTKTIADDTFMSCNNLEKVIFPDSLTHVGCRAFAWCDNLTNITIPKNLMSIGRMAFNDCHKITNIEVDKDNDYFCSIDGVLFDKGITKLFLYPIGNHRTEYVIPGGVTDLADDAFEGSFYLESIVFPDTLKKIGDSAFSACINLKSADLPYGITTIPSGAFEQCFSLESVTIPDTVNSIESYAFSICMSLEKIIIPASVTYVGAGAFYNLAFFKSMTIKGLDVKFEEDALSMKMFTVSGISRKEFVKTYIECNLANDTETLLELFEKYVSNGSDFKGTIYCHEGSTAEVYAKENGFETIYAHFGTGEWLYDYDNMIRYRECIHCEEFETEKIEAPIKPDVPDEPETPDEPDTPSEPDVPENPNESTTTNKPETPKKSFFEKIIEFFKNIFDILFGWVKN